MNLGKDEQFRSSFPPSSPRRLRHVSSSSTASAASTANSPPFSLSRPDVDGRNRDDDDRSGSRSDGFKRQNAAFFDGHDLGSAQFEATNGGASFVFNDGGGSNDSGNRVFLFNNGGNEQFSVEKDQIRLERRIDDSGSSPGHATAKYPRFPHSA